MTQPRLRLSLPLLALTLLGGTSPAGGQSFVNFESGHVRPLALSPDGSRLFAVNTPDNRLAIYDVTAGGLTLAAEVPVGLEPVAVAARTNTEVWVVNHLSDSVSIVTVDTGNVALSRVTRTLLVGDEPRDIVFAGAGGTRAFVTCAHRGQNRPGDPQLTTEGIGRADVWAFDALALGAALGGTPLSIVQLFGDTPRALAKSPDGSIVYAAVFHSGNRTTPIVELAVNNNGAGLVPPGPPMGSTPSPPDVGLIVKFNASNGRWEDDETGQNWAPLVPFSLPDQDVFLINANGSPPALLSPPNAAVGVGTILFNMATRPTNGRVFVANSEAFNQVRFEPEVNGHLHESHISVIDPATAAVTRKVHLNPLIDYGVVPGPPGESATTLAFPMDMAFSADGSKLFVVGFGTGKVGVFNATDLENGIVTKELVTVGAGATNGGPSGVVLDAARDRLYVMNRFDHALSIVSNASLASRAQTAVVPLRFDPSPATVRTGRRFLYDAGFTSSHGDSACSSCHVFADFDSLAWDLGDPFGSLLNNPNPFRLGVGPDFHPMKGPMSTQSLRGMAAAGPMHWRGDRTAGNDPGGDPLDEDGAFKKFNPAFVGLLGRSAQLTTAEMQAFADFILSVRYPPNPIRALSNAGTAAQNTGETFFNTNISDGGQTCQGCHRLSLGTDGFSSFEGEPQEFKIAHFRNLYQKVGMFGFPGGGGLPGTGNLGDQVRGVGFLHDGSVATVFLFLNAPVFSFPGGNTQRRNVESFLLAFDTGLRPAVGQQVSATQTTFADTNVTGRATLLVGRDEAGDCDLVVKGNLAGQARGWVYDDVAHLFRSDRASEALVSEATLRAQAGTAGQERTFTCVPPGSGTRVGIDRDLDGFFDRTELDAGSDPANPASVPGGGTTTTTTTTAAPTTTTTTTTATTTSTTTTTAAPTTTTTTTTAATTTTTTGAGTTTTTTLSPASAVLVQITALTMKDETGPPANPAARKITFKSSTRSDPAPNRIVPPARGSAGDPTLGGATLTVYNSSASGEKAVVALPAGSWLALGAATSPKGFRYVSPDPTAAVRKVIVKADRITLKGGRASWPYTLDEPSQGSVALRLALGAGAPWCAEAGQPGYPPRSDQQDRFTAFARTPAPPVCAAVP